MTRVKEDRIAQACSTLFGEGFSVEPNTIDHIQLSGIKHAFRKRAKDCHPDTANQTGADSESFLKLKDAYDFLISVKTSSAVYESDCRPSPAYSAPQADNPEPQKGHASAPQRRLKLGEYLYYTEKISRDELIAAISWQRKNKHNNKKVLFGMYFTKFGILSSDELGFSVFKMNIHNSNY